MFHTRAKRKDKKRIFLWFFCFRNVDLTLGFLLEIWAYFAYNIIPHFISRSSNGNIILWNVHKLMYMNIPNILISFLFLCTKQCKKKKVVWSESSFLYQTEQNRRDIKKKAVNEQQEISSSLIKYDILTSSSSLLSYIKEKQQKKNVKRYYRFWETWKL